MSKKKRFGISQALTRGLSETINVVENNLGVYRHIVLPLSRVELDPDNPRKMNINLLDVREGIRTDDPLYQRKSDELEKLKELAHTIKSNGIINPIVVYKQGELYRIVAGERRCLASILAGKQEIEARCFNQKPKAYDLKLIQWVENTAREDLSLYERLGNVKEIITEYQKQFGPVDVTASLLRKITGLSLSQTTYYLQVLNAPSDLQTHIKNGNIRNLDKAAFISGQSTAELRNQLIEACIDGSSLKQMRAMIAQQKVMSRDNRSLQLSNRGRLTAKINMGTTQQVKVIKAIVESVLTHQRLGHHTDHFSKVNWVDLRQTTRAFRRLIEILEVELST